MHHPVIIGAGGVASYLLPVLLKTFKPAKLTLIDKDVLEKRNLDRQLFPESMIGQNKAHALRFACGLRGEDTNVIDDWFSQSTTLPDDIDAIICCADNHEARLAAIDRAAAVGCYAYVGGNEFLDSQAFVYHLAWAGTPRDPLVRYPNIATDHTGSPFRCQGDAQVAAPQLAVANLGCAAKLLHLMWVYERWLPPLRHQLGAEALAALPYELNTTLTDNSRL
jgi:molybdopterin/thiamine biosynthesis adenylyltransferase